MPEQTFHRLNVAQGTPPRICPQLGLHDDRATRFGYPTTGNFCYKSGHPTPVEPDKQSSLCLCLEYSSCSIFQGTSVLAQPRRRNARLTPWKRIAILTCILAVAGALIAFGYPLLTRSQKVQGPSITSEPSQLANIVSLPATPTQAAETPTATGEIEASSTPSPSASPTNKAITPTQTHYIPTIGPLPGTPFGPAHNFILYVAEDADSLTKISEKFNTSPDVVLASNEFKEGRALWPGDVLVILPGVTNPEGVIRFKVIELASSTDISDLAAEYNVSVNDLKEYNSFGSSYTIPAGRLVIIPVP